MQETFVTQKIYDFVSVLILYFFPDTLCQINKSLT